jgi:hypothetical protein
VPPYRIDWLDEAAADVRALDRDIAMRLFDGILARVTSTRCAVTWPALSASGSETTAFCSNSTSTPCESSAFATDRKLIANHTGHWSWAHIRFMRRSRSREGWSAGGKHLPTKQG